MTAHIEAKKDEIAQTVIMPGDPLRAKFIAETYLKDYKLVNTIRNIYAYTGYYKDQKITIMASGMGMPSIGIYSYELYKFYDVQNIIRIGSCGAYIPELNLFDIVLSENVYSESNYALTLNNDDCHIISSSNELNNSIKLASKRSNIDVISGNTVCTDCFDVYMTDVNKFLDRVPDNFNPISAEMEAFALFYNAKLLNRNASCLMSVVDSKYIDKVATSTERQTGLNNMIIVALESLKEI